MADSLVLTRVDPGNQWFAITLPGQLTSLSGSWVAMTANMQGLEIFTTQSGAPLEPDTDYWLHLREGTAQSPTGDVVGIRPFKTDPLQVEAPGGEGTSPVTGGYAMPRDPENTEDITWEFIFTKYEIEPSLTNSRWTDDRTNIDRDADGDPFVGGQKYYMWYRAAGTLEIEHEPVSYKHDAEGREPKNGDTLDDVLSRNNSSRRAARVGSVYIRKPNGTDLLRFLADPDNNAEIRNLLGGGSIWLYGGGGMALTGPGGLTIDKDFVEVRRSVYLDNNADKGLIMRSAAQQLQGAFEYIQGIVRMANALGQTAGLWPDGFFRVEGGMSMTNPRRSGPDAVNARLRNVNGHYEVEFLTDPELAARLSPFLSGGNQLPYPNPDVPMPTITGTVGGGTGTVTISLGAFLDDDGTIEAINVIASTLPGGWSYDAGTRVLTYSLASVLQTQVGFTATDNAGGVSIAERFVSVDIRAANSQNDMTITQVVPGPESGGYQRFYIQIDSPTPGIGEPPNNTFRTEVRHPVSGLVVASYNNLTYNSGPDPTGWLRADVPTTMTSAVLVAFGRSPYQAQTVVSLGGSAVATILRVDYIWSSARKGFRVRMSISTAVAEILIGDSGNWQQMSSDNGGLAPSDCHQFILANYFPGDVIKVRPKDNPTAVVQFTIPAGFAQTPTDIYYQGFPVADGPFTSAYAGEAVLGRATDTTSSNVTQSEDSDGGSTPDPVVASIDKAWYQITTSGNFDVLTVWGKPLPGSEVVQIARANDGGAFTAYADMTVISPDGFGATARTDFQYSMPPNTVTVRLRPKSNPSAVKQFTISTTPVGRTQANLSQP